MRKVADNVNSIDLARWKLRRFCVKVRYFLLQSVGPNSARVVKYATITQRNMEGMNY